MYLGISASKFDELRKDGVAPTPPAHHESRPMARIFRLSRAPSCVKTSPPKSRRERPRSSLPKSKYDRTKRAVGKLLCREHQSRCPRYRAIVPANVEDDRARETHAPTPTFQTSAKAIFGVTPWARRRSGMLRPSRLRDHPDQLQWRDCRDGLFAPARPDRGALVSKTWMRSPSGKTRRRKGQDCRAVPDDPVACRSLSGEAIAAFVEFGRIQRRCE